MTPEQMAALNIPAEYHREQIFVEAPDLATVFKVARDLNAYKGASIRVPGPEASAAEKQEFAAKLTKHAPSLIALPEKEEEREAALLERLGVPKEAKEYAPPAEHGLPEAVLDALRAEAKEEGLTKKQFERRVERAKLAHAEVTRKETEAMAALKKDLGPAFEESLLQAAAVAKKLGRSDEEVQAIKAGRVPVETAKTFLAAAKALGESSGDLGGIEGAGGPKRLTREEVTSRIQEIYRNPAFLQKGHPQYRDLQAKLLDYNRMLYPEE